MDKCTDQIFEFEQALKNNTSNKRTVYSADAKLSSNNYKIEDVIFNVSKQISAIQSADRLNKERQYCKNKVKPPGKDSLSNETLRENIPNKFETQCVSETQLVDIVQIVEAHEAGTDIMEEFDNTFCQNFNTIYNNNESVINKKLGDGIESLDDENTHIKTKCLHINNTVSIKNSPTDNDNSSTSTAIHNGDVLKTNNEDFVCKAFSDTEDFEQFEALGDFQKSPILNKMNPIIIKTNPTFVCKLDCFEMFEALALPIIEEYPDLEVAKKVIHSQIGNKELFVETNVEPFLRSKSPILASNNNLKKHYDTSMPISTTSKQKSHQSVIEDEILFSSDEENNHSSNYGEDLPLTCALHTSFYDYTGVLDKTMYVGFQTASNKTIQVNSDSFLKAQNLLSVDELENIELNELVNRFDNNSKTYNNSLNLKTDKDNINSNNNCDNKVVGFKTATGKTIDISKNAIIRGAEILKDIDISNVISQNDSDNKYKGQVEPLGCKSIKQVEHCKETTTSKNIDNTLIKLNDDNIIQEFESNLVEKGENNNNILLNQKICNEVVLKGNEMSSSKPIHIPNKPIELSKRVSDDVVESENISNATPKRKLPGFKTASNKNIAVSDKSLIKYKNILDGIDFTDTFENLNDDNESQLCNIPMTMGFSTASNKKIIVTQKALLRTKAIFENVDMEPDLIVREDKLNKNHLKKFKPANNNVIGAPKEALSRSNIITNYTSDENIKKDINMSNKVYKPGIEHQGFRTAANKPIMVSSQLIDKYKNIFEDIDICENSVKNIQYSNNNSPSMDKLTNKGQSKLILQTAVSSQSESNKKFESTKDSTLFNNDCDNFQGFQTASHKKINIPKEKLAKYLKVFDGIDVDINEDKNLLKNSNVKEKIQTIKNENITESEASINKQANTQQQNLIQSLQSAHSTLHQEKCIFQTAGNKPISVTQEAFEASQKVINGPNTESQKYQNSAFVGFNTASKRKIDVTKETLAKAKKFFGGIDETLSKEINNLGEHLSSKFQFQTANNKMVNICEETSNNKISKEAGTLKAFDGSNSNGNAPLDMPMFSILDLKPSYVNNSENNLKGVRHKDITNKTHSVQQIDLNSLNNILDTQIIKNFEDTLHTEDFLKETSPTSKRSGSPILPCPKAKKRRFETPASVKKSVKPESQKQRDIKGTFVFDSNYKKNKLYKLQDLNMLEERCKSKNIDTPFYDITFENILEFEFSSERNDLTGVRLSISNIKEIFAESVNKRIIPSGWIENHLKLIIWKLLSYEIKYPNTFYKVCSVRNVMEQLKYRYDRELYNVQRPAFRKILERDDVASKTMIVCVVGVCINGNYVSSVANLTDTIELLVTDGWYCIMACIDKLLAKYVFQGKISVGTKLVIHGAELINCDQGITPWEDTSCVRLKLFGNSTRRARWDARLGYHSNPSILTQLSAVKPDGGKVSKLRVFVTRVYPTLYVEKFEDGSTVTRTERLENLHQMKYESDRQMLLEKIYEDVEKEFYEQESQDSDGIDTGTTLETGSQIAKAMKKHRDPAEFKAALTESQLHNFLNHTIRHKEKQMELIQKRVREKIHNSNLSVARNVVPLMKIRVASVEEDFKVSKGMISIWRPNEEVQEIVTEGKWIQIYNIFPTAVRYSEIQLSASRQSIFQNCEIKDSKKNTIVKSLKRRCYTIQDISKNSYLNTDYNEIDTAGFLFLIEPSTREFETSKQLFQNVFLADANKNIICINFWGGIKKFGFEHILDTGQIVACVNLQKRSGNTMKSIPQYRATEFSYFTKTPKYECIREASKELLKMISGLDKRKFQEDCVAFKNNFAVMKFGNDVSPYRMNNSDYNISKNKVFIDSPILKENNFNLSGLDFESSFKQKDTQDMAPHEILRKKRVSEKISKLKMYGEPPPISPMSLNSSKDAVNAFKSPLTTRNNIQVKNAENLCDVDKIDSKIEISPVLPPRKSGKRPTVNPVKLNFNVENGYNTADPFEDDFEASPPLSLD